MNIVFYTGYHHCEWNCNTPGIGGSETAVVEIAKRMVTKGHIVTVVGQTVIPTVEDGVTYTTTTEYKSRGGDYDVDYLIGVNYIHFLEELGAINPNQSIFWAHNTEHFPYWNSGEMEDQGDWVYDDPRLTAVVCVSEWQKEQLSERYPNAADRMVVIGNGIFTMDYPKEQYKIQHNRFIYSSAADRGLDEVLKLWPIIKADYPSAELVVCGPSYASGDYNLRLDQMTNLGVTALGSLSKKDLYIEMVKSQFWIYPSHYDETFCITGLEMMYGSCIPITTDSANLKYLVGEERGFITSSELVGDQFENAFLEQIHQAIEMSDDDKHKLVEDNWDWAQDETWMARCNEWIQLIEPKTVDNLIERIYIIALDPSNEENKQRWEQELEAAGLGDIPCEMVQAVDGTLVDDKYLEQRGMNLFDWKIESTNGWWDRIMKPGEKGCALSHYGTWKMIYERGIDGALILEEDFKTIKPFTDNISKDIPCNWDMLYLGRNPLKPDASVVNENIVIPENSYNLHSYAISKSGAKKLMDQNFPNKIMPVDEFMIATYTTHEREDLHYIWADSITYAVADDVFSQGNGGKESMTEHIHTEGRKYPELYSYYDDREGWERKFLSPGIPSKEWDLLYDEPLDGVACLPFFTDDFCRMIAEEAEYYNGWTTDRHEFYPTTDILLHKIGFNDIFNELLREYVMPMCIHLFGLDGKGWDNMNCENFLARYVPEAQGHLSVHHDASDLTALVNLSEPDVDFDGGGTWFLRQKKLYRPPKGSLSIHPGNITHKHGARSVTKGTRFIMVSFMNNPDRV